jgi:hypothetical protein
MANRENSRAASAVRHPRSILKSEHYRLALQRAVVANLWSSQQAADHALRRFQMARKAGMSVENSVDFAFEGLPAVRR